jgi:hypothetical protein
MSQDFFADLERQLVAATTDRTRRLRRARARRAATLSTILVAVLAAGAGLAAAVTGGGGGDDARHGVPAAHGVTTATAPPAKVAPALDGFTTSVLNGTSTPGLARGVANQLAHQGAKIGNVTNASTQHATATRVYAARVRDAGRAILVAERLGLGKPDVVLAAPAGLRAVAGDRAAVIVVVGRDQQAR